MGGRAGFYATPDEGRSFSKNKKGEWVPSIPLPIYLTKRRECACGAKFWTDDGYRGHYALKHILDPD